MKNPLIIAREISNLKEKISHMKKIAKRLLNYGDSQSDKDNYLELKEKISKFGNILTALIKKGSV